MQSCRCGSDGWDHELGAVGCSRCGLDHPLPKFDGGARIGSSSLPCKLSPPGSASLSCSRQTGSSDARIARPRPIRPMTARVVRKSSRRGELSTPGMSVWWLCAGGAVSEQWRRSGVRHPSRVHNRGVAGGAFRDRQTAGVKTRFSAGQGRNAWD